MMHRCVKCGMWKDRSALEWMTDGKHPLFKCADVIDCGRILRCHGGVPMRKDLFEFRNGYKRGKKRMRPFK